MNTATTYTVDEMYEILVDALGEEAIALVVAINGYNAQTMEDILYAATGLRDFADLYR